MLQLNNGFHNESSELPRYEAAIGLTAVICTRNRPEQLHRALLSLTSQTSPAAEIIVVDNAPVDDATRLLVMQQFPSVRYVCEPVQGLDFARNRALCESTQEIIAFLDDDAVADRNWSQAITRVFKENPQVGACTGRVDALSLETEGQRLFEANGGFSRGDGRICLPCDANKRLHGRRVPLIAWAVSVGNGCSMALKRSVAIALGGFDEALDMGAVLPGGGDLDMLWRVLMGGFEICYEPQALAWHEHRRELDATVDQIIGHQRALVAFLTKTTARENGWVRFTVLAFLTWRLLKPGARLLRRLAGKDPLPAKVLLRMWWNCWLGLLAYRAASRIAYQRTSKTAGIL